MKKSANHNSIKINNSLTVKMVVAALIVAGITGFVVYSMNNNTSNTSTSPSPTPTDEVATIQPADTTPPAQAEEAWPTYTNPYDGYSIQYPNGWFVQPAQREGSTFSVSNYDRADVKSAKVASDDPSQYFIEVYVQKNPDGLSLDQFIDRQDNEAAQGYKMSINNEQTLVSNNSNITTRESYNETTDTGAYEAYTSGVNRFYIITGADKSEYKNIFEEVVRSFRLTR